MIRFSSVLVSFAESTVVLGAGEALTTEDLAGLLIKHAGRGEHAVTSSDRPTLVAATKAFRSALAKGIAPKPVSTTVAYRSMRLAPLAEASDAHREEVMRLGSTASPEAKAAVKGAVEALPKTSCTIPLRTVGPDRTLELPEEEESASARDLATITGLEEELLAMTAERDALLAKTDALEEENAFLEGRIQDLEAQLPTA